MYVNKSNEKFEKFIWEVCVLFIYYFHVNYKNYFAMFLTLSLVLFIFLLQLRSNQLQRCHGETKEQITEEKSVRKRN